MLIVPIFARIQNINLHTRSYIRFTFFFAFLMIFMGCEEDYVVDHDFKPHLVVDGIFEAGKPWEIGLSKTKYTLDPKSSSQIDIDRTIVSIHDVRDQFLYHLYASDEGIYTNEFHYPQAGKTYVLHVSSGDLPDITARAKCPAYPEINFRTYQVKKENANVNVALNFDIEDVTGSDVGYYWDIVFRKDLDCQENCKTYRDKLISPEIVYDILSADVLKKTAKEGRSEFNISGIVSYHYSGESFDRVQNLGTRGNGSEKSESDASLDEKQDGNEDGEDTPEELELVGLRVMTVDNELIDYYKNILSNPTHIQYSSSTNYRNLRSNVKGGYGIFSGINVKTVTVN